MDDRCRALSTLIVLALLGPPVASPAPLWSTPHPAAGKPSVIQTGRRAASLRKQTDVLLSFTTPVPPELAPAGAKSGEKAPARLEAAVHLGPLSPITAICFSPDGSRLLVGTDHRVSIWDPQAGRVVRHLEGLERALAKVHSLAYSPDGRLLAAAGGRPVREGTVLLYDGVAPASPIGRLTGHSDVVYCLAWSPDGRRLATASLDKTVRIWDAATRTALITLRDHSDFVYAVAFSPDGKLIASGGKDRSVKLFDAGTGKSLRTLSGHSQDVLAVAFTPDGKSVLSSGLEPALRWWNAADGSSLRSQPGHGGEVYEIQLSKEGKSFMTVSQDQTVRLWDAASGAQQKSFSSGGEGLLSAALSPDGKRVVAGSWSGLLHVWDAASGRLLAFGFERPDRTPQPEFLVATPEGYVSGTEAATAAVQWRVRGEAAAQQVFRRALARPEEVLKALQGEAVTPVKF